MAQRLLARSGLTLRQTGQPQRIYDRAPGQAHMNDSGNAACRIPGGHPEGYLEAFATIYSEAATLIRGGAAPLLPTVQDGVDGVNFVEACVASSKEDGAWRTL